MSRDPLPFFDANCLIGRTPTPQPGAYEDAAGLLAEMDRCGIGEALVAHTAAQWYDPVVGAELLTEAIAGADRLRPCWAVLPAPAGRMPAPGAFVDQMLAAGARAARVYPLKTGPLRGWLYGGLLAALAERRVVTLIDFELGGWGSQAGAIDWDGLHWLCGEFPALPVVLPRVGFGVDRALLALMEAHENIYVETSYYLGTGGLERLVARFGPHRALFGTGMPVYAPGPGITVVTYSGLDERAKRLVAGGNLRRLLESVVLQERHDSHGADVHRD